MGMVVVLRESDEAEIKSLLADPEKIHQVLDEELGEVDLDKAWHAIHFLLTGSVWEGDEPLCYLVAGGEEIGNVDVGYGPARALMPIQIKRFNDALTHISLGDLRGRFNPEQMKQAEIYPDIWMREPESESLHYVLEYFEILKSFVRQTAEQGKGAIVFLT